MAVSSCFNLLLTLNMTVAQITLCLVRKALAPLCRGLFPNPILWLQPPLPMMQLILRKAPHSASKFVFLSLQSLLKLMRLLTLYFFVFGLSF